jgi:monovalent cation/hydrogen antiporter
VTTPTCRPGSRRAIVQLPNQGAISNDVMHRIERDLDLEDSRLEI